MTHGLSARATGRASISSPQHAVERQIRIRHAPGPPPIGHQLAVEASLRCRFVQSDRLALLRALVMSGRRSESMPYGLC